MAAAISSTLFAFRHPGDRVVSTRDTYGGTHKLFGEFLPAFGIEVALCETHDAAQIQAQIAKGCRMLYLESPTNPTVKVVDIARLSMRHSTGIEDVDDLIADLDQALAGVR